MDNEKRKQEAGSAPGENPVKPTTALEVTVSEEPAVNTTPETEALEVDEVSEVPEEPELPEEKLLSEDSETLNQAPAVVAAVGGSSLWARRKWWLVVAGVLLIAAAVAAYLLTRPADTPTTSNTSINNSKVKTPQLGVAPTLSDGVVEYSLNGKTWAVLTDKVDLKAGDAVRTGADGRVVLTLDDGSAVRLGSNASIKLASLDVKNVRVENTSGEVYSRVISSAERSYTVVVDGTDMVAKGTAFRTISVSDKKGVEVYQSTVKVKDTDVTEGKSYFTVSSDATKKDKVSDLDLNSLKNDSFLKWNVEQDKKITEAKDKLGVLVDIDKPAPTPTPTPTPAPQPQANGIVLSGTLSGYTGKFTWKVTGVDTSKGFKLVKSSSTKSPVYPGDSAQYISSSGARNTTLDLDGGKTYYFRVCAYRGDGCDSYSNTVTLTTPPKTNDSSSGLVNGTVTASLSGTTLSWTITGTAPKGYKVVRNTTGSPVYPGSDYLNLSSQSTTSVDITGLNLESGMNYIRVCKYTGSGCTDYSNQVTYTVTN